jgi:hypothetical protein
VRAAADSLDCIKQQHTCGLNVSSAVQLRLALVQIMNLRAVECQQGIWVGTDSCWRTGCVERARPNGRLLSALCHVLFAGSPPWQWPQEPGQ